MTVKELKEKLAKLPEEYDDLPIKMDDPDYENKYYVNSALSKVTIDILKHDDCIEIEYSFYL